MRAEYRGAQTTWHPAHIAERYGPFTIIVLGEVVLGTAGLVGVMGIGVAVLIMGIVVAALATATVALADRGAVAPAAAVTDAPADPS